MARRFESCRLRQIFLKIKILWYNTGVGLGWMQARSVISVSKDTIHQQQLNWGGPRRIVPLDEGGTLNPSSVFEVPPQNIVVDVTGTLATRR